MKRMTDEEFDLTVVAGGWRPMYAAAREEADRARAREARLEAALVSIRDNGRALSEDWIIQRATDALEAE